VQKVIEVPLDQDLKPLSVYWWQKNIPHQIVEQSGAQVVFAEQPAMAEKMRADFLDFNTGRLQIQLKKRERAATGVRVQGLFMQYPITLLLVVLSIVGFAIIELDLQSIIDWLVIQSIDRSGLAQRLNISEQISVGEFLAHGQYWRLITPIFLHFGWVHIAFNMLWLWELGRRIEVRCGSLHLLSVVIFIGIASNLYQAASTPLAYFGGMSGVIYGLLGYSAVFNYLAPHRDLVQPKEVYIFMLASLAIGWLGIFDFLALMANSAHLSGLIGGALIALPSALLARSAFKK
jgi:GlpG protein